MPSLGIGDLPDRKKTLAQYLCKEHDWKKEFQVIWKTKTDTIYRCTKCGAMKEETKPKDD